MLNITGSRVVEDVNFRYKMPRMIAKTEGRGNGIKTVIGMFLISHTNLLSTINLTI